MRIVGSQRRRLLIMALVVALAGAVFAVGQRIVSSRRSPPSQSGRAGEARTIGARTSTGRAGAYYLPSDYASRPLPLLVVLHGTGGKGSTMLLRWRALAERSGFIVIAPDSVSVAGVWLVEQHAGGRTEDHRHVVESTREVLALPNVRVDPTRVLISGFSAGGGAAFHIASYEGIFTAFAVLHGHVVLDGMGPRRVRGWLSTGDRDRLRTVESLTTMADRLKQHEGFPEVETRVFRVDHALGEEELAALIAWWLGRPVGRDRPHTSTSQLEAHVPSTLTRDSDTWWWPRAMLSTPRRAGRIDQPMRRASARRLSGRASCRLPARRTR